MLLSAFNWLIMMNKNTVLAWATFIMILVGCAIIALVAFKYQEVAGWGFASVGFGFFAIAWVFNALKGRV
jgi:glycerol uptake facilitator-like aquaporin